MQHFRIDCLDYKVEIVSSVEGSQKDLFLLGAPSRDVIKFCPLAGPGIFVAWINLGSAVQQACELTGVLHEQVVPTTTLNQT